MPTEMAGNPNAYGAALTWARRTFPFTSYEVVTDHPWADVLRLNGEAGFAFLKIVPTNANSARSALGDLSNLLAPDVPSLINFDARAGLFLYQDHNGVELGRKPDPGTVQNILTTYAKLQVKAAQHGDLISQLPSLEVGAQFGRLMDFLSDTDTNDNTAGPVTATHFLKRSTVARYQRIFQSVEGVFKEFLALRSELAPTINHCDLRGKNIAQRPDGSLVIFDWDDAMSGPPGLSLQALFGGSARSYEALSKDQKELVGASLQDRKLLDAYLDALSKDGFYDRTALAKEMPAVICGGTIQFILNFGEYAVKSRSLREVIGKNIRRRLSDLMDLAHLLVQLSPKSIHIYARALNDNGRTKRAQLLLGKVKPRSSSNRLEAERSDLTDLIAQSDTPDIFPTIEVSNQELDVGVLSSDNSNLGATLFKRHGSLMIKNAVLIDLIRSCHSEFMSQYNKYLNDARQDDALRVGDKRFMITIKFDGAFANPGLFASPMVMPIIEKLLGKEAVLGSLTTVASLPGSEDQRMHKDNSALFKDAPDLTLPSFSIAVIVPMVALNAVNGATRIVKGSHLKTSEQSKNMPHQDPTVDLGSCFLMDCRLSHRGKANNSDAVRPIASLVYQRAWYRDHQNFQNQKALNIDAEGFECVRPDLKHLVSWAIDV